MTPLSRAGIVIHRMLGHFNGTNISSSVKKHRRRNVSKNWAQWPRMNAAQKEYMR
jgi:hypothetical protein